MQKVWRKHYRSMYEGSLMGAGALVFAVMHYAIDHQDFDPRRNMWVVRMNPVLVGTIIGEKPDKITEAIEFLCEPDPKSTSQREQGRRLMRTSDGGMEYQMVNGEEYQGMRQYEAKLEQDREAQRRLREARKASAPAPACHPLPGEVAFCQQEKRKAKAEDAGGQ